MGIFLYKVVERKGNMIISASRRTDIPSYYSEWFLERVKEKYVLVKNPMNPKQIGKVSLSPDLIDCIVFWTKNPEPILSKLHQLQDYMYYFQYTITGYQNEIEVGLPDKWSKIVPTFQKLSDAIGSDRVILRYDPVLLNTSYTIEYHLQFFGQLLKCLNGYTKRVVVSFIDFYAKMKQNMKYIEVWPISRVQEELLLKGFVQIASEYGMVIETCSEVGDYQHLGVMHGACIDKELIESLVGLPLEVSKDKNQRKECGCVESIDIGTYNTCLNGCVYCYANYSPSSVKANVQSYQKDSPILCHAITEEDHVYERKIKAFRQNQYRLEL